MENLAGTTVVLADALAVVREGFARLCEANGMKVLGQCSDGPSTVEMILAQHPDLAILDFDLPVLEAIRELRRAGCPTKLVVLSVRRNDQDVIDSLDAGADAFLPKDGPGRHLLEALWYVRDGGRYVSPLLKGAGLFSRGSDDKEAGVIVAGRMVKIPKWLRFWRRR